MRIYLSILLSVLILISCSKKEPEQEIDDQTTITCDAESMKDGKISSKEIVFGGTVKQSDDFSKSGKYSIKLDSSDQYGFVYNFTKVKKGNIIQASVWRKKGAKKGVLVISTEHNKQYLKSDKILRTEGEWDFILLNFVAQSDYDKVTVMCFNPDKTPAYFDDLKIESFTKNTKPNVSNNSFVISIDDANFSVLKDFRTKALDQGIISDELKKYVKATINIDGKEIPVKLRLKGDWTDHLRTNKWSFRIKVSGENSIYGMKTFSIQDPNTRSYMMEWFVHKLCQSEDILTPRYKFIPVVLNGENMGVYALEEHFDKQLLEYNERREGPIVKFDESGIWAKNYLGKTQNKWVESPGFVSSKILPFKKKRTSKNPVLNNQFIIAQGLMNNYKTHQEDVNKYLDVKQVGKYLAIMDLASVEHGMIWHNQRWYFNPVKNVLEPIAYDCFMDYEILNRREPIFGNRKKSQVNGEYALNVMILNNRSLKNYYLDALKKYSSEKFITSFIDSLSVELYEIEKLIQYEFPNYKLDKEFFIENAKLIREEMPKYIQNRALPDDKNFTFKELTFEPYEGDLVFEKMALQAYTEAKDSLTKTIKMVNYHTHEIEIIGYGIKANEDSLIKFSKSIKLNAFKTKGVAKTIQFDFKPKMLFYKAANNASTFKTKVSKYNYPKTINYLGTNFDNLPYEYTGKTNEVIVLHNTYSFSVQMMH